MVQFPDDRHNPRSADGTEPILGGSVALNRILLMLKNQAQDRNRIAWSAVAINSYTFFRNVYQKDVSIQELIQRFKTDIELFRIYLDAYLTYFTPVAYSIPIVIYLPDYRYFPNRLLRDVSPSVQQMDVEFKKFSQSLHPSDVMLNTNEVTDLWCCAVGSTAMLPHIELAHWLQTKTLAGNKFGYRYGMPIMLISHCPVDLHIYRRIPNTFLIESHQGTIRPSSQFGHKLSTQSDAIPFLSSTHQVFGDPIHLAPRADSRQRKLLLEMAVSKPWMQRPTETVLKDIIGVTGLSVADLSKLRL